MHTAGRPASPTIHPRTRPEANEFAIKNRSTSDWYRHDGKNVEVEPAPPQRLQGYVAPEVAEKNKGDLRHSAVQPDIYSVLLYIFVVYCFSLIRLLNSLLLNTLSLNVTVQYVTYAL